MESLIKRKCPSCGRNYHARVSRLRFGRETTCSRRCSYRLRGEEKKRKVCLPCSGCGKDVERSPSHVKRKDCVVFCSRRCHYDGRSTGLVGRVVTRPYRINRSPKALALRRKASRKTWRTRRKNGTDRHTDDTRRKLSEATARHLASTKHLRCRSKLELDVEAELRNLGASFETQVCLRGPKGQFFACVDFRFSNGTVLEVNGSYWHVDPRIYPKGPINGTQTSNLIKYQRKLEMLAFRGIRVVELWELDLRKDLRKAVRRAYAKAIRD